MSSTVLRRSAAAACISLVALGTFVAASTSSSIEAAGPCPAGYRLADVEHYLEEFLQAIPGQVDAEGATFGSRELLDSLPDRICRSHKHPEPRWEVLAARSANGSFGPVGDLVQGQYDRALDQQAVLAAEAGPVPGSSGSWEPWGDPLLIGDDPRFGEVAGQGFTDLSGRVDSFDIDPATGRLFAAVGTGGIWMSEDQGVTWSSIGDALPSWVNGAVAWTSAAGGTLVVVSGEHTMGGNAYTGVGAFWSNDLGTTWHKAAGVPDGALGFDVAVDHAMPDLVYVATSQGLFRSDDAGRTFVNTNLPTSPECAGVVGYDACQHANFVTDVIVKEPGGSTSEAGGEVLAAVGYRAGLATFGDGTIQSPRNGLYRSDTGEPGTFEYLDVAGDGITPLGFTTAERVGRVEFGPAIGPEQDHNIVYAIVEDAALFNGGVPVIDAPGGLDPGNPSPLGNTTSFNGIYVSTDFGDSWTRMADDVEIAHNPLTGSSLAPIQALIAPGVQAWYNLFIAPDPTRQVGGVPTRLVFGLEEVFQTLLNTLPLDGTTTLGPSDFLVIGTYFAGDRCLFLVEGLPLCPTSNPPTTTTTTHPDQHAAIWLPTDDGGVTLLVGNDGGVFRQTVGAGGELDNAGWAPSNDGFNTLLPYSIAVAADGTTYFGLQDNGTAKTESSGETFMAWVGDGTYAAVDPDNPDYAWASTPNDAMVVTLDGGETWRSADALTTNPQFVNPFVMDPLDSNHLLTAGTEVMETLNGPDTAIPVGATPVTNALIFLDPWVEVFNLGNNEVTGAPNRMSAIDLRGDAAYVGFCGLCDIIGGQDVGFHNGLATNVGGGAEPQAGTGDGWHFAAAQGLPNRFITSVAIDPDDPKTVYVTLGGYANRQWVPPDSFLDTNDELGDGHVFKSTDAGENFVDITGSLPDIRAAWIEVRSTTGQLVVGNQLGVYLSSDLDGTEWAPLEGLPAVPISMFQFHPGDEDVLYVATYGRGNWRYAVSADGASPGGDSEEPTPTTGGGVAVAALVLLGIGALARRGSMRPMG